MSQNFHVIRCAECRIFQVHIIKKSNKWNCKVCSTKQSVQQVFGKGTGAECRVLVQNLNLVRGAIEDEKRAAIVDQINSEILAEEEEEHCFDNNIAPLEQSINCDNSRSYYPETLAEPTVKSSSLGNPVVPTSCSKWSKYLDEDSESGNHLY